MMEKIVDEKGKEMTLYTEEQLMARLKFFVGICLALTLVGIVFVVLYSLIFVTQPMNAISPMDQKFFELIIPIATFLTGTLSGIMLAGNDKDARMEALKAANKGGAPSGGFSPPGGGFAPSPSSGSFSASANIGGTNFSFSKPAAPSTSTFTPTAATGAPQFSKPANTGPVDSDFMPPRDDD